MGHDAICFESMTLLARRIREKELSPSELVAAYLDRIARVDRDLGSYLTVLPERAMEAARRAERVLAEGRPLGPLHGVPVAVKDLFDTAGVTTTYGSRIYADHVPIESATAVTRLEEAGAILLGKLHLTEFAFMAHHPDTPVARNPWERDHSPGGSSSGSAMAVAAGLCAGALGSDTVASIRLPAAWCGTVGLKPTWGRVSCHGVYSLAASFDHVGPVTHSVEDAALMLHCIAGPDPLDPTTRREEPPPARIEAHSDLAGLRVGWDEAHVHEDVSPDVVAAVIEAREVLRSLGATVVPIELPDVAPQLETFARVFEVELCDAHTATFPERADDYSPALSRTLRGYGKRDPLQHVRGTLDARAFRHRIAKLFEDVDVLLSPTVPSVATALDPENPHGVRVPRNDRGAFYWMRFTCLWNMAATPAIALPWGFDAHELPRSVQLVGAVGRDRELLSVAACLEARAPDRERHPILPRQPGDPE